MFAKKTGIRNLIFYGGWRKKNEKLRRHVKGHYPKSWGEVELELRESESCY